MSEIYKNPQNSLQSSDGVIPLAGSGSSEDCSVDHQREYMQKDAAQPLNVNFSFCCRTYIFKLGQMKDHKKSTYRDNCVNSFRELLTVLTSFSVLFYCPIWTFPLAAGDYRCCETFNG